MKVRLAFSQTIDDRFVVLADAGESMAHRVRTPLASIAFDHEDSFLELAGRADLPSEDTARLVSHVLRTISHAQGGATWTELDLDADQLKALGLLESVTSAVMSGSSDTGPTDHDSYEMASSVQQFRDFLMKSPIPFMLLLGPEHRIAFANRAYLETIRRTSEPGIHGQVVRQTISGEHARRYLTVLDSVYSTGESYFGSEIPAPNYLHHNGDGKDRYFDIFYQALRNHGGAVSGIMAVVFDVSERVLVRHVNESRENRLYAQWAELDAIYRSAPVGMALIEAGSFRLLRLNQRQAELLGAPVEALLGKEVAQVAAHIPDFAHLLRKVTAERCVSRVIVRETRLAGDATRRSWLVNLAPTLSESGGLSAISAVFLEVPGEVWNGSEIEDSDNLISDVLESTTDSVCVLDRDWNYIYLNLHARKGLPNGDALLGRNMWEAFPEAAHMKIWDYYHQTMLERTPTSFVTYYPEPLNRWFEVQAYPAPMGITTFFRDVTQRELQNLALRESELHYRSIVDLSPQVPFTMSADGQILDFGARWQAITGASREQSLGYGFVELVHPDDLHQLTTGIGVALSQKAPFDIQWRLRGKDGIYLWMRSRGTPLLDADGELLRVYGSTEDIDELTQLRTRIEELVRETA